MPIAMNHTIITGPNIAPTRAVPLYWTRNSAARITTDKGTTYASSTGVIVAGLQSRPARTRPG